METTFDSIQEEVGEKIKAKLDKVEIWARENYDGSPKDLESFVEEARADTLGKIEDSHLKHCVENPSKSTWQSFAESSRN